MLMTISGLAAVAASLDFWLAAESRDFGDGSGFWRGLAYGVSMTALSALLVWLAAAP